MNNFYNLISTEISSAIVVFNIILSFALQMVIIWIYKKTHNNLSYSQSFVFTLAIVGVLGTVVMIVVQNNLIGAFALLGAFSLIRFRTILKETRDIAFVFFALVIGIAVGVSHYSTALIATVLISLIIFFLDYYKISGFRGNLGLILTFDAKDSLNIKDIRSILSQYSASFSFLQSRTHGLDINNYVFSLKLKDNFDAVDVIKTLKNNSSVINVEIITGEHSVEF